jgi:signal transduction histidine kinase/ActR/RegA family two-component response regulator
MVESIELMDIIDVNAIQSMMDDFFHLTKIGVAILDMKGNILVATGWQDICTQFHRKHPETLKNCIESDLELSAGVAPGSFKAYRCKNNMWDIATPIVVGGIHMGNLYLGQFFYDGEMPDVEWFRSRANRYGFDETAYLAALERVPRWSKETVQTVMQFYTRFTALLSESGYSNLKLANELRALKQAEISLKAMKTRLMQAQKLESIGSLAGGIAHDFNNLLFPIVGLSEMMLDDFPPESPYYKDVQQILKAGKRGRELVQQILSFSRQSRDQLIPVHIQKILKEALKLCRATIPADIPITRDIQTDCRPVMGDPTQIHQIVMNLVTNAFHAVEPAGGTISIRLKEIFYSQPDASAHDLASGAYAMLSVSDTGTGIDPSIMDKIFDPYFTTKTKGRGTGLGLATVYGIVKALGGDIRVDSEVGEGSCFHVYLPVQEISEPPEVETQPRPLPTGTEHILLVDDEASVVHLEKQMLERLGYRTTSFTDSLEALAAFEMDPSRFDLVITDMHMPELTGLQLAEEMIFVRPDLPVILCTGFSERINREKIGAVGIRDLLMKPVGMVDLAHKVREVIDPDSKKE